jgi:homocysteine S-methyltransferase
MTRHRDALPQLAGDRLFLGDGGIETTLIFLEGLELPDFAAFHLLATPEGRRALEDYFRGYAELARRLRTGLVLESPTWRSSPDWGRKLGYTADELDRANRDAVALVDAVRRDLASDETPVVVSGCVGPRGDGYVVENAMSADEAADYHATQVDALSRTEADLVTGITMTYAQEAIGLVRAARRAEMPTVIAFTVETDGRLPSGQPLKEAIEQVDAETEAWPSYFMINCAHPSHFSPVLEEDAAWTARIRGLKANASRMSHEELNEATELDVGDPAEFGRDYAELKRRLPGLAVMGGCCGTDLRHLEAIGAACRSLFPGPA